MNKTISIGMPVYNCEEYIEFTIKSILNQSYKNWALIIIDDRSTDRTLEIIKKFQDPRITLHVNNENEGLAACLNKCIALSTGDYFARMDGDDIMISNRLEFQLNFLETNTDVDVVGGMAYTIDKYNNVIGIKKTIYPQNEHDIIKLRGYFIHPTVMGRTDWFKQNNYDPTIKRCQDFELWLRSFTSSKFHILDEYLIFYREIESIYKKKYFDAYMNIKLILQKHRDKVNGVQYHSIIIKAYIKYFLYDVLKLIGILNTPVKIINSNLQQVQSLLLKQI